MRQQLPPYITQIISDYPHTYIIYFAVNRVSGKILRRVVENLWMIITKECFRLGWWINLQNAFNAYFIKKKIISKLIQKWLDVQMPLYHFTFLSNQVIVVLEKTVSNWSILTLQIYYETKIKPEYFFTNLTTALDIVDVSSMTSK